MNINRLFPRLTIRAKLTIAFVALALAPLALVAALTMRFTVANLVAFGRETLIHDVVTAGQQTEQLLVQAARDAQYVARAFGPDLMTGEGDAAVEGVRAFLRNMDGFYQFRVLDAEGDVRRILRADGDGPSSGGARYYAVRAALMGPGDFALQPAELPLGGDGDGLTVLPVVAVIVPVFDGNRRVGTMVGEAYASMLFRRIEDGTPSLAGVTGLVDAEGLVLFHSTDKRSWSSLTALSADSVVAHDLGDDPRVLQAWAGQAIRVGDHVVAVAPLRLANSGLPPISLYRVVPLAAFRAPVRRFLTAVALVGTAVAALVVVLASLGAREFTGPILRLRRRVADLRAGRRPPPARIATNDELEDLARDFDRMAEALADARQQLEEALAATAAELGELIAYSADAIVGVDADGRVRVWNRGAERLFGWPEADAIGRDVEALLAPPGGVPEAERQYIARELRHRGAVVNLMTARRHRDGRLMPVSLTQTTLPATGERGGTSLILRDAGEQSRLMDQMRRSERLAATSLMAAALAHEINNPLGILANRIELMRRDAHDHGADDTLRRDLDVLYEHAQRLQHLTQDLLRFARDEEEDADLPVPAKAVAERVARLVEASFASRNVAVRIAIKADGPGVLGARGLETVLMNLVLNAADAMPDGGGVTIGADGDPDEVRLWVEDTGTGVPAELHDRIFEPFFTTKRSGRGTGLGLAVCRGIVERQGGRLGVESAPGGGARFVVTVPAAVTVEAE